MIGFTPREAVLAVEHGGHAAGFGLALAELSMYWDQHPDGAPEMHEPRLNIRITAGGTIQDRIDTVKRIADWLGVGVAERYGGGTSLTKRIRPAGANGGPRPESGQQQDNRFISANWRADT